MSSAGHILDSIKRQAQNRAMQQNGKYSNFSYADINKIPTERKFNQEKFSKLTSEEIATRAAKIKQAIKKEKEISFLKAFLFLLTLFIILYLILTTL